MKKRILGIVMALAMVLTMIPATAFATQEQEFSYTLQIEGAKAVYSVYSAQLEKSKTEVTSHWQTETKPMFFNEESRSTFSCDTWATYYPAIDEVLAGVGTKHVGTEGNFTVTVTDEYGQQSWELLVLTEADTLTPGTPYAVYYGTSAAEGGAITLDTTPIETGNLMSDEPPATKTSKDENVTAEGTTEDVEVDYTYLAESNIAEKVFNVTIDYTFPATLDAAGAQNTYTWDPTEGKYTKGATSTAESYTLSNEGAFEIKVTNHSNVNIDYAVSYAANDAAVFANALDGDMTNATGTVNTIAQGHEVTADGINITNANTATATMTGDFNNATCTGKLKVTGINTGKTPLSSGKDKLGTFTIGISEKVTVPNAD